MNKYLLLLLLCVSQLSFSQEFDSDLFASLNNSALHLFTQSEKTRMTVTTYRNSKKHGTVVETTSTYRKGKINPERINFNIKYSEFYVVEDRKKSLGKYEFKDGRIFKYERTDFNNLNARMYTVYYNYIYNNEVVERENIRTKEYIASGSVDFDTIVYRDTVMYDVNPMNGGFKQDNLSDPGVYTEYEISDGQLLSKTVHFEGYIEKVSYTYDSKGHLVKIISVLTGKEAGTISTTTELHYSMDGLLTETKFYDETNTLLERKVYAYK